MRPWEEYRMTLMSRDFSAPIFFFWGGGGGGGLIKKALFTDSH